MKKTLIIYTLLQAACWVPMLLCDLMEEYADADTPLLFLGLIAGLFVGILFVKNEPELRQTLGLRRSFVHFFAALLLWGLECLIFGAAFFWLVDMDFIPQGHDDGWISLNGIEYMLFPAENFIAAGVTSLLALLGRAIFRTWRRNKAARSDDS